jgi:cycloeucalenol cycloisomerase
MAETDISVTMGAILGTMIAMVAGLTLIQTPRRDNISTFLPLESTEPSKRAYELFTAIYAPFWIICFVVIVAMKFYEDFTAWSLLKLMVGLDLPLLLQPILLPSAGFNSPDAKRPLLERYALKANVWLIVYSFIGNYWYTHYFYSVLKAKYTMPAHRFNDVPIALYFATHFYFSFYHVLSNVLLRKVVTTYEAGFRRKILFVSVICIFSYFTAFMETLTISAYPEYSFEDRNVAYTVGSAFYAIYFLVSYPAFFYFDTEIDQMKPVALWETFVSGCGHGMMILSLLDFVRLYLQIPLTISG